MKNKQFIYTEDFAENIYFVSDSHFSHENIIKYCKRPFASIEEHDEELIRRWNEKVPKNGIVFHLGDVAFGNPEKVDNILRQLNGIIYLVIGNHDWRSIVKNHSWRFFDMSQQVNMKIGKRHIILNHYPMLAFSGAWRGVDATYQLFGHVHTSPYTDEGLDQARMKMLFTSQYDVGVDNNNFTPVSWKEVDQIINNQMMSLGMCRNEL
ncbi:metallophosphoesterase family protein [bacterium]|nr:metallophosphoesterase family protein [bacterium]